MSFDHETLRVLLTRAEDNFLDFKVQQYKFDTERQASGFIKDIVSMANTPRNESAYIVIGIDETDGRPTQLVGVNEHIDPSELDRQLQDRVNTVPAFEYHVVEHEGREIGIYEIKLGRGGAGFSTGLKWSFVPKDIKPCYLCCNADESEPGTFSNRYVLEKNPHLLIEGILICCYAMGIETAYIYIRGEFTLGKKMLDAAIKEAYEKGYLGKDIRGTGLNVDIYSHPGAGAYICGEETGLIESLEGKRGQPRNKPPFPAVAGVFGKPTVVQNVETLCNLPFIVGNGVEWYTQMGPTYADTRSDPPTPDPNTGTKLYCISGDVNEPGVYELELGLTCSELIEVAGGLRGEEVKAVIPGGSSAPILTHYELDTRLDFTALTLAKSMLGSGGIIVMNETRNIVDCLLNIMKFYAHESCGQCTPCRWGTPWVRDIVQRIADGNGQKSTIMRPKFGVAANGRWGDTGETEEIYEDLDLLESVANNIANVDTMTWNTICVFWHRGFLARRELYA